MAEHEPLFPFRIWKFAVPAPDSDLRSVIDIPRGARVLSVALVDDEMFAWALVPEIAPGEYERHALVVGNTGTTIRLPPLALFLGTVITSDGTVWHVWDGGRG